MNVSIRGWARVSANVRTRAEASLRPSRSGAGERISRSGCSERKRGGWARIKRAGGARPAGAEAQQRRSPTQAAMGAGTVEPQMGLHQLLHVFLEAQDMLCVAQVDRVWNEASRTKELWRQLCLRRWSSCKASQMTLGTQTWKQYYLCRSELEFQMESGWPEKDFICKAIAGHKGEIDELAYISTKEYWFDGREKSVVCAVSSDGTVCAWDLQEVSSLSSPLQPAALVNLVTYPRLQLAVTVDERGLIKVCKAENGCKQASCLPTYSSSLEACDFPEGPLLLIIQVGSKSNDKCPYNKRRRHRQKGERPCENGGRDWSEQPQAKECQQPFTEVGNCKERNLF
ncbi:F-box/WD repeat-containing protein 12 [Orcinus orca]|uniref:F-box/WD repeat-containing protein 12 n=1 Tax=Orcinus orca TaxID=9733 RepID=UPI0021136D3F|nr:F-box/WD repeat-containing protein 12 [Orcinus orca]